MRTSLVIRSHNEASRLRLTLASLEGQPGMDEVVVVDDGSSDDTPAIIQLARETIPLRAIRNERAVGRSAASNRGAEAASGDILIFLDGDTLAGPGMVAAHRAVHEAEAGQIARGFTSHLRCTRFLSDPQTGAFWPEHAARASTLSDKERDAARVTLGQVQSDFAAIERRAAPGVYPGAAPARLYQAEMAALRDNPESPRLWAAASGSNLSMERSLFLSAGGFDEEMDINEHRELAYRLCLRGARMTGIDAARSYHLTHRVGWRDPLSDDGWERRFLAAHPEAPLTQLKAYWRAISTEAPAASFFADW
jgi:glycosyltransferase involved in cell wall biosynthesis